MRRPFRRSEPASATGADDIAPPDGRGARAGEPATSAYAGVLRDRVIWAWMAVAVAIQTLYVAFADPVTLVADQNAYVEIAGDFGQWWDAPNTEMLRMPGYPLLLALLGKVGLGGLGPTQALQIGLLAGCVAIVAHLGYRVGGRTTARVAGGLFATYLPLLSFSSLVLTEALTVSCGLGATVCALRAADRSSAAWLWWCGGAALLMAVSFLIRPASVAISFPLVALIVVGRRTPSERLGAVLVVGAAFAVALGPWMARNQALNGSPLPTGTTGAYPAAIGVHLPFDRAVGQFATYERSVRFWTETRPDGFGPQQASEQDWAATLRQNLRRNTGEFLVTRAVGQYQLWGWPVTANTQYGRGDVPYAPLMIWHLALLLAGIVGFWRYRRAPVIGIGIGVVVLTAGLHLVTFPQPRYALVAIPFLIVGVAALVTRAPLPARRNEAPRST